MWKVVGGQFISYPLACIRAAEFRQGNDVWLPLQQLTDYAFSALAATGAYVPRDYSQDKLVRCLSWLLTC